MVPRAAPRVQGAAAPPLPHDLLLTYPPSRRPYLCHVQVSVGDLEAAERRFDAPLEVEGFRRLPYERDHVPAGLDDDPTRWAKRFWSRRDHPDGDVNLHVRLVGSPNERLALLFRDWLRAHPAAVDAYAAFKLALAEAVGDPRVYTEVKDPVVDVVIAAAEPWALQTGWTL